MKKMLKEKAHKVIIADEYTASGYMVGGVHGHGLKVLCSESYTRKDLEKAYKVYIYCCGVLQIEPREFYEVV